MKTERMVGILAVLMQRGKMTAGELAERFEVSKRTILRDAESLCLAGFPVLTEQGAGGGISVMEGFVFDKNLLTADELRAVLAGLKSLDSVSGDNTYRVLMQKLGASDTLAGGEHILIDLSSYYKQSLAPKIRALQKAAEHCLRVRFVYLNRRGESVRVAEPYFLIFQWASWYLYAWCCEKKEYRLFKLNRMSGVETLEEPFVSRNPPPPELSARRIFAPSIYAEVLFKPSATWRVAEEFGKDSFTVREDGNLYFSFGFADRENLFSWLLSFGKEATLLKPENLRAEFEAFVADILGNYQKT